MAKDIAFLAALRTCDPEQAVLGDRTNRRRAEAAQLFHAVDEELHRVEHGRRVERRAEVGGRQLACAARSVRERREPDGLRHARIVTTATDATPAV